MIMLNQNIVAIWNKKAHINGVGCRSGSIDRESIVTPRSRVQSLPLVGPYLIFRKTLLCCVHEVNHISSLSCSVSSLHQTGTILLLVFAVSSFLFSCCVSLPRVQMLFPFAFAAPYKRASLFLLPFMSSGAKQKLQEQRAGRECRKI